MKLKIFFFLELCLVNEIKNTTTNVIQTLLYLKANKTSYRNSVNP